MEKKLYTLSILVRDIPGVLSQVARLFSRKGYNIESIVTGGTDRPGVTRLTIVILGDELMVSQITAQCRKLIPVLAVKILDEAASIQREFSLIKVQAADRNARDEVIQMANIFRANIIDVSRDTLTVAIFGDKIKTSALTELLEDFGILEIAKTGTLAIERGRNTIYDDNKLKEEYNYGKNVL
ncbi:MAG: acetolactate synthase small subunit [Lawsonibacter sp.]|nr:acetolactate synthase small subunit [Lawsonibacter sp.]